MKKNEWLEKAIYTYIGNHENCEMLGIVAHFKELMVNITLLSLRRLVDDGKVQETQEIMQHTYKINL